MNILYQFDDKYAFAAGVSITSLLANYQGDEKIDFYILGVELSQESINKLNELEQDKRCTMHFIDCNEVLQKLSDMQMPSYRNSQAANIRLLPEVYLPNNVNRILYLDSDTIINSNISELYNIDMQGLPLGMCKDSLGGFRKSDLGFKLEMPYFNSGVILFDMEKWKEEKIPEKIQRFVRKSELNFPSPDQDLLNVVCKNKIFTLDIKYNYQAVHAAFKSKYYIKWMMDGNYYTEKEINAASHNAVVYHCFRFLGEFPWNRNNRHPYRKLFESYKNISPWKEFEYGEESMDIALKIEKIMYLIMPKFIFAPIFRMGQIYNYYNTKKRMKRNYGEEV